MNGQGMLPPLALLAGGLATRLYPLTESIPKSMLEVAGEPFIAHQLRLLQRQRITEVVICAGFMAETIQAYVGTGERFGLSVRYSLDGGTLLGTGGAIKNALPLLGDTFFVMYGDSYLPVEFAPIYDDFQCRKDASGLMTVFHNQGQWDTSNVSFREGHILDYSKTNLIPEMEYIDYGLGILTATAFEPWMAGEAFDLADVYGSLLAARQLAGHEVYERFYEIGSRQGLQEMQDLLRPKA